MASPVQAQKLFGAYFAHATGLSPQVVGKWLAAEQGPGSAATPGSNNWLNIQYTDSGPNSTYYNIAHLPPRQAAQASAKWLRAQSGLRGILHAAGKGLNAEVSAIENSGWASSHYNNALGSVKGYSLPAVSGLQVEGDAASPQPGQQTVVQGAPAASGAALAVLTQALARQAQAQQQQPLGRPAPPSFSAGPQLPEGARAVKPLASSSQPDNSLKMLLAAAQAEAQAPGVPSVQAEQAPAGAAPAAAPAGSQGVEHLKGTVQFDGKPVAAWIAPILRYGQTHGWKGGVNSGYRTFAEQKAIYDSGVRPAAVPGTSNHEGKAFPRGAVDVSNASELAAILAHSPYRGVLVYAGSKDPVHFSHPHNGSY